MPARKGLLAPQNTFLDTIANRFDGTHSNFVLGNAKIARPVVHPIVYCSDGFCELTGFSRARVMQKSCACDFLYGAKTDAQHRDAIMRALNAKQELKLEVILYKSTGTPFWCLFDIVPIQDEKHEVVLFLCTQKDITKEKIHDLQQQQLAQMHAQQEQHQAGGDDNALSGDKQTNDDNNNNNNNNEHNCHNVVMEQCTGPTGALINMDEFEIKDSSDEREFDADTDGDDGDKHTAHQYSRRRSRAVLYQLSGHYGYRRSVNMKSKLKLNNQRMNIPEYKTTTIEKQRFILSHYGVGKSCWDWLILIVTFYVAIVVPYNATFKDKRSVMYNTPSMQVVDSCAIDSIDVFVEIVFVIDVLLNFRTTFVNRKGEVVTRPKFIFRHYVRGWFVVDACAAMPFDLLCGLNLYNRSLDLNLLKLIRLLRLARLLQKMDRYSQYSYIILTLLMLIFSLLAHWCACIWYVIALEEIDRNPPDWNIGWIHQLSDKLGYNVVNATDMASSYVTALYFTTSSLTSVGFGNVSANTNAEKIFSIVIMLIGALMHAVVFGNVTALIRVMYARRSNYQTRLRDLKDFFRLHQLPKELQQRMSDYFQTTWSLNHGIETNEILKDFPEELRGDVSLHLHREVLSLPIFELAPQGFLKSLARHIESKFCCPTEYLIHRGDALNYLYLVCNGSMEVLQTGMVVAILGKGDLVGYDVNSMIMGDGAPNSGVAAAAAASAGGGGGGQTAQPATSGHGGSQSLLATAGVGCAQQQQASMSANGLVKSSSDLKALTYCDLKCIYIPGLLEVLKLYPEFSTTFYNEIIHDLSFNLRETHADTEEEEEEEEVADDEEEAVIDDDDATDDDDDDDSDDDAPPNSARRMRSPPPPPPPSELAQQTNRKQDAMGHLFRSITEDSSGGRYERNNVGSADEDADADDDNDETDNEDRPEAGACDEARRRSGPNNRRDGAGGPSAGHMPNGLPSGASSSTSGRRSGNGSSGGGGGGGAAADAGGNVGGRTSDAGQRRRQRSVEQADEWPTEERPLLLSRRHTSNALKGDQDERLACALEQQHRKPNATASGRQCDDDAVGGSGRLIDHTDSCAASRTKRAPPAGVLKASSATSCSTTMPANRKPLLSFDLSRNTMIDRFGSGSGPASGFGAPGEGGRVRRRRSSVAAGEPLSGGGGGAKLSVSLLSPRPRKQAPRRALVGDTQSNLSTAGRQPARLGNIEASLTSLASDVCELRREIRDKLDEFNSGMQVLRQLVSVSSSGPIGCGAEQPYARQQSAESATTPTTATAMAGASSAELHLLRSQSLAGISTTTTTTHMRRARKLATHMLTQQSAEAAIGGGQFVVRRAAQTVCAAADGDKINYDCEEAFAGSATTTTQQMQQQQQQRGQSGDVAKVYAAAMKSTGAVSRRQLELAPRQRQMNNAPAASSTAVRSVSQCSSSSCAATTGPCGSDCNVSPSGLAQSNSSANLSSTAAAAAAATTTVLASDNDSGRSTSSVHSSLSHLHQTNSGGSVGCAPLQLADARAVSLQASRDSALAKGAGGGGSGFTGLSSTRLGRPVKVRMSTIGGAHTTAHVPDDNFPSGQYTIDIEATQHVPSHMSDLSLIRAPCDQYTDTSAFNTIANQTRRRIVPLTTSSASTDDRSTSSVTQL